jgi:probable phosphomutase (TIGR03848 family)
MPTLLLIRHGENDYVKSGKMAGRIPGVHLNEKGQKQAKALSEALKNVPLKAVYSSPLERAMETAGPMADSHKLKVIKEPDLMDTDIGKWQGKSWRVLGLTKIWKIVQNAPSRFRFPDGESFLETQTRVANALDRICIKHNKPREIVAVIFHADPIRIAIAHYLGMPLDHFQRLGCDTGSISVLHVSESRASLLKMNQRPPFDFLPKGKGK